MSQVQELSLAPFFRKQETATWLPRAMALQQKHHEFITLPSSPFLSRGWGPIQRYRRGIQNIIHNSRQNIMILFWKYLVDIRIEPWQNLFWEYIKWKIVGRVLLQNEASRNVNVT
jgi:hypothetical protein